jgi:pyruvate,water dikinase
MRLLRTLRKLAAGGGWRPLEARRDARAALHLQYLTFKDLIASNDEILEIIADVDRKLAGDELFGMAYVRSRFVTAATHAYRMIANLNSLSGRRYQELYLIFSEIQKSVEGVIHRSKTRGRGPFVYPLSAVDFRLAERVGGKSANLGELKNLARLPVPGGFAITTDACLEFLEANHLWEEIRAKLLGVEADEIASLAAASEGIREAILAAPLPPALEEEIRRSYEALSRELGFSPRVALRSSAVGEDSELSFAGQYVSLLNVAPASMVEAYKEVIAGLYTPRAIYYRMVRGIPDEDIPMGVACLAMIEAAASGVASSVDPSHPAQRSLLIHGAWGLGVGTVGGSVSPDSWVVSKDAGLNLLRAAPGSKESSVEPVPQGGVESVPVPPDLRGRLCLTEAQVKELACLVIAAEAHYQCPQELEWALDRSGKLFLLQSRPVHFSKTQSVSEEPPREVDGCLLLLRGASASGGCASGPVFLSQSPADIQAFPEGAVLVARHSSPQYVKVMGRAAAIVTDVGATTGHMASLAREFGIPAVLDTRDGTSVLTPGATVTVDGGRGAVYMGKAESLLAAPAPPPPKRMRGTPVHAILEEASRYLLPLNLTDPRAPEFTSRGCKTFHDIARFVHEKAFEEIFRVSDRVSDSQYRSVPLAVKLPFEVYLIDLGGGLARQPGARSVTPDAIRSLPMAALLKGMTDPALRWWEPRAVSLRGFASVASEALFKPMLEYGERKLGDRSYAIVADAYCNFSSRIGYHFTAVDAYCSGTLSRNYISFRFKGGAADEVRRANRCLLIGEILKGMDFQVERQGDLINARIRKFGKEALVQRLEQIGRLVVATRQLDMRMGPGAPISWYVQAFLQGNYLFDSQPADPPAGGG